MSEGLCLCYCDLDPGNFILEGATDSSSRLWVVDFEHVSWLPLSFMLWEVRHTHNRVRNFFLGDRVNLITDFMEFTPPARNQKALRRFGLRRHAEQFWTFGWRLEQLQRLGRLDELDGC